MAELVIETGHLTKIYDGKHIAVNDVNLNVEKGTVYGFLGPNGAGKTTLIKILCTLLIPTSGRATINGMDLWRDAARIRASVGLVNGDERSFYWRLSGRENLEFFAALYNLQPKHARLHVAELLDLVGLTPDADRAFQNYSAGMKQRLAIARSLLNDPEVLFLDEPTKNLDPLAMAKLHAFLRDELVSRLHKTIWLTTQRLDEAERLCNRIAFMRQGKILAVGTFAELSARLPNAAPVFLIRAEGLDIHAFACELRLKLSEDLALEIPATSGGKPLHHTLEQIVQRGGRIVDVQSRVATFEELFAHFAEAASE
jgi:ABC-2 type transport system ATP-binding protein